MPGTPLFNQSSNSNGLQTSTLPPKSPASALIQGNRWSPLTWGVLLLHNWCYNQHICHHIDFNVLNHLTEIIGRHNSRPDLTYRAPSPAGSFYQVRHSNCPANHNQSGPKIFSQFFLTCNITHQMFRRTRTFPPDVGASLLNQQTSQPAMSDWWLKIISF